MYSRYLHILGVIALLISVLTLGMAPATADEGSAAPGPVTDCGAWDFNHVILKSIDDHVFNIEFEWMPFSGATTYRFKLHRQGVAPFEYLFYGDLGTLIDISDLEPDVPGIYTFMVTAYDDAGNELCTTSTEGHSFEIVEVYIYGVPKCTPYVVVLPGSPYLGPADIIPTGDDYDGRGLNCGATIHGNDNSNVIYGTPYNDAIYGYGGDDVLHGVEGDDTLYGGAGDDFVFGGTGSDTIEGDTGMDTLFGGWDNSNGESRDDVGCDTISDSGGDSDDWLFGGNYNLAFGGTATGNDGNDILIDSGGDFDVLFGGNWNDAWGGDATGDDGNDTLIDSGGDFDMLLGGNANIAFGGNATGHDGSDTIIDSGGAWDWLYGGNCNEAWGGDATGNDNVDGGNDTINANDGAADVVFSGNDNIFGGTGTDHGSGSDTLNCDAGDVCVQGNLP